MVKLIASSLSELNNKANYDHVTIKVEHEEDEALNVELVDGTDVVMVTNVKKDSFLCDQLKVGDYFLSINERKYSNREEMFRAANRAYPELRLVVARAKSQASQPTQPIPSIAVLVTPPSPSSTGTPSPTAKEIPSPIAHPTKQPAKTISAKKQADEPPSDKELNENYSFSSESDPKSFAKSKGFIVKPDRQYFRLKIVASKSGKSLGLGIIRVSKDNSVIVSSVQANSVSNDVFKAGDRFLTINKTAISDVQVCRKLILETKGDFTALIERPPNGLQAYGLEPPKPTTAAVPLRCSYSQPLKHNPDHKLGNAQDGYQTAPEDVQAILNRQIPTLIKSFGFNSQSSSKREKSQKSDSLKIENDVHEESIQSDIAPGSMLKKPPKQCG